MKEKQFAVNNTKLVNTLKRDGCLYKTGTLYPLVVFSTPVRGSQKNWDVTIKFRIDVTGETFPLKPVDFLIMDAVYNMFCSDNSGRAFSLRQLDRVLTGETDSQKQHASSDKRLGLLEERIENLMNTRIYIDYTDEAKARRKASSTACIIEDALLTLEKKGKKYLITDEPPLYKYSDINGQVQLIPYNLFFAKTADGECVVKNTLQNILIKYCLIHELEVIRSASAKYSIEKIPFLELSKRSTESHRGILTQLHRKEYFGDEQTDSVKCECVIQKIITTDSVRHSVSDIEKTVVRLLDFYKDEKYLESYTVLKKSKRRDMPDCGLPDAITDIHFYKKSDDSEKTEVAATEETAESVPEESAESVPEESAESVPEETAESVPEETEESALKETAPKEAVYPTKKSLFDYFKKWMNGKFPNKEHPNDK
ncbi:MAG: hypothetical protein ACI4KM_01150 [Oscillospiraceae bacterium]